MLIASRADVNFKNECGRTPLHFAAQKGHVSLVKILIDAGAAIDATDENKSTPLHFAVFYCSPDVVSLLIQARADVCKTDKAGKTPIDIACENHHSQIAKMLEETLYTKIEVIKASELHHEKLIFASNGIKIEKGLYKGQSVRIETLQTPNDYELESIQTYAKVQMPHILPLLAYVRESPLKDVLPYITQGVLREFLKKQRAIDPVFTSRFQVALTLAKALEALHERNLVHRDLTSYNVFLSNDIWKVKLSYFDRNKDANTILTVESIKSMLWSAPEVMTKNVYTFASDIYSFGVILSELDTLKFPYEDSQLNGFSLMLAIPKGEVHLAFRDNCEPWYRELALQCLNENPN
ncbi:serine/threonine-protein kinase TNNI3K-like [Thraustotheca clavata]|uniref:Serine/threonine-protein kinase TNNI3K-like n=1 Tax=Thraustotheca clavata TaxID=74557 RepID=A0A1V9ZYK1_9STRA|nr:serine/threonine-protein kinase TNNI3K-like [Thraustotheca clavata]